MRLVRFLLASSVLLAACGSDSGDHTLAIALGDGNLGSGTITGTGGINCEIAGSEVDGVCTAGIDDGTEVTLTAEPGASSTFGGWEEECTGLGPCTFTMSGDKTIQVTFLRATNISIVPAGASTGGGTVTSEPAGLNCTLDGAVTSGTCTAPFAEGITLTLFQTPDANSVFSGWNGSCFGLTGCSFTVEAGATGTPTFTLAYPVTVTVPGGNTGTGTVTSTPPGINCQVNGTALTGSCTAQYPGQTSIQLMALPTGASTFGGWTGVAGCGAATACTVPLTSAQNAVASFVLP